jgi:hypothetical protein
MQVSAGLDKAAEDQPAGPSAAEKSADADAAAAAGGQGAGRARLVHAMLPLAYLSASQDRAVAVRKLFAALTRSDASRARVTAEHLALAMYPHGTASGEGIFRVPYTPAEIAEVCKKLGTADASGAGALVAADQLVYNVHGARLLAACGARYELRDVLLDMWRVKPADAAAI